MEKQGRRERNKIRCRQRILRASRQLFSAKGYEETTMDDVAERSEVSKATLYNYFPGKDSLLMGIAEAELEQIREMIEGELAEEPSALERLRRVLEAFVLDSMVGVIFVKILNIFTPHNKINPMVGAAGISAFPMSSRVIEKLGQEADPQNHLLMHAAAANVSGQIASVVAGGVVLQFFANMG